MKKGKRKDYLFVMRMDDDLKSKLEDLAANKVFKHNNSALVTYLINLEHLKKSEGNK